MNKRAIQKQIRVLEGLSKKLTDTMTALGKVKEDLSAMIEEPAEEKEVKTTRKPRTSKVDKKPVKKETTVGGKKPRTKAEAADTATSSSKTRKKRRRRPIEA